MKEYVQEKLKKADIIIGGDRPWDIQVHNQSFYKRALSQGSLGIGEAYMDGWWSASKLDACIHRVLQANLLGTLKPTLKDLWHVGKAVLLNLQSKGRAFEVGKKHYDVGNDLFLKMLDPTMSYSCAYWKEAKTLEEAQRAKLDLVCRKLHLKPGMTLLDIGSGWGSLAYHAAKHYGVEVVGITVSREQLELAKIRCEGLSVKFLYKDYRDMHSIFDRVVSVGQMEHVGYRNYRTYMKMINRNLKEDGIALIHSIGNMRSVTSGDPWIERYIFPNGMIPSSAQIARAADALFIIEDWHNFGMDYDPTLIAWYENFKSNWGTLKEKYDDRFFRMWEYYLLTCAALFRSREMQLWQIVFTKKRYGKKYEALR